jgi:hypothetical protein
LPADGAEARLGRSPICRVPPVAAAAAKEGSYTRMNIHMIPMPISITRVTMNITMATRMEPEASSLPAPAVPSSSCMENRYRAGKVRI